MHTCSSEVLACRQTSQKDNRKPHINNSDAFIQMIRFIYKDIHLAVFVIALLLIF